MPAQRKVTKGTTTPQTNHQSVTVDAIALLTADHRTVEQLFKQFEAATEAAEKKRIASEACRELAIHTILEEEIFYPACRGNDVEESSLDEAQVEHDAVKILVEDIQSGDPDSEMFTAKVKVLSEYVKHHVGEEEKPDSGIFARAKKAEVDMADLGSRIQTRKEELKKRAQSVTRFALPLRAIQADALNPNHPHQEQNTMPRNSNYRDRDERGRFVDEDDDRRYGSQASSRGRYSRDDDDDRRYGSYSGGQSRDSYGRFTDDDDGYRYRSQASGRGRDERGRFTDDDDDSRGRAGSRGHGGWFGDPEGHSMAARSRSSGRYAGDDDEYRGRGGDDYRGRGGNEGRGWYGDPQGHSEASRRGWEERGGYRSRSSGRDYDDDRGGSRGGHGGWFGDSEGHSEASHRGWGNR